MNINQIIMKIQKLNKSNAEHQALALNFVKHHPDKRVRDAALDWLPNNLHGVVARDSLYDDTRLDALRMLGDESPIVAWAAKDDLSPEVRMRIIRSLDIGKHFEVVLDRAQNDPDAKIRKVARDVVAAVVAERFEATLDAAVLVETEINKKDNH